MRKVVFLLVAMLSVTMSYSQEKKVSMYNEVALDASAGGYGSAIGSLTFSYTGGVNLGKCFSTGITLGYDPLPGNMLSTLKLRGVLPKEKVLFYASASGGVRTTFKETQPSIAVSAGVGIKSKKSFKNSFNIGPMIEFLNYPEKEAWGKFVGIKLGYQF